MDEHDRRTGYGPAATKTSRFFAFSRLRARQEIRCTFCCWPPGPLARRERRAFSLRYVRSEHHSLRAAARRSAAAHGDIRDFPSTTVSTNTLRHSPPHLPCRRTAPTRPTII